MTARLTSAILAGAIIRRVNAEGGHAAVIAKGDQRAGAIILVCADRGNITSLRERIWAGDGYAWQSVGPDAPGDRDAWLHRRRLQDPDLWIVELDIPNAERFAAESIDQT